MKRRSVWKWICSFCGDPIRYHFCRNNPSSMPELKSSTSCNRHRSIWTKENVLLWLTTTLVRRGPTDKNQRQKSLCNTDNRNRNEKKTIVTIQFTPRSDSIKQISMVTGWRNWPFSIRRDRGGSMRRSMEPRRRVLKVAPWRDSLTHHPSQ